MICVCLKLKTTGTNTSQWNIKQILTTAPLKINLKRQRLIVILFILQLMKQKAHGQQDDMLIWLQITILITQSISEVKQDFGSNRRH